MKIQQPEYRPRSVREILTDMKDTSDLMVDLAFAAILYKNVEIAEAVHELESKMDELMYTIRIMAAVAARNVNEAKKITGILQVASAAEKISNATGDIADLVVREMGIHPVIFEALEMADEQIVLVKVKSGSVMTDKTFKEMRLPSSIGVWTFALKRGGSWILSPTSDVKISVGDILLARGPTDGTETFIQMAGEEIKKPSGSKKLAKIRNSLSEVRDLIGIMVDMAYSSILFGSKEIANEVRRFEKIFDDLNYEIWLETLKAAKVEKDVKELSSILQISKATEKISDAADLIVDVVLRGTELHPVFSRSLAESKEQIAKVPISVGSPFVGKSLSELKLWDTMGAYVFMIERKVCCIVDPPRKGKIKAGDVLFVRGSPLGVIKVKEAAEAR